MAAKSSAFDRRAFPRVPVAIPVEVLRTDLGRTDYKPATLSDISQNGALLVTTEAIPNGEWIQIRPDQKGAGFGVDVVAIVDRNLTPGQAEVTLSCRFPQPIAYSVLQLFMK